MRIATNRRAIQAVVLVIIIAVGFLVFSTVADRYQAFEDDAEEWCQSHGGDIERVPSGGGYSGLVCDLPSDKSVDMSAVAERDWPESAADVPSVEEWQPPSPHVIPLLEKPYLFVVAALLAIGAGFAVVTYRNFWGRG